MPIRASNLTWILLSISFWFHRLQSVRGYSVDKACVFCRVSCTYERGRTIVISSVQLKGLKQKGLCWVTIHILKAKIANSSSGSIEGRMMITKCCFSELLKNVRANVIHCSVIFKNVPVSVLWLRVLLLPTADGTPSRAQTLAAGVGSHTEDQGFIFRFYFIF